MRRGNVVIWTVEWNCLEYCEVVAVKKSLKQVVFWMPRILCVLFAVFISLFALDVFGMGYGFWGTIVALLMHLVPTVIILIALAIAWRWEWIGAILFVALGVWYVIMDLSHLAGSGYANRDRVPGYAR